MSDVCNCLTHLGSHWQHLDALHKAMNHELLVQAMRYVEAGKASRDVAEDAILLSACEATMRLYAQEELARLSEKLKYVENLEKEKTDEQRLRETTQGTRSDC